MGKNGQLLWKNKWYSCSHRLGELGGLIVDVCHPHTNRSRPRVRLLPAVRRHHNKLVQMVGPLVIQPPRRENGPVR